MPGALFAGKALMDKVITDLQSVYERERELDRQAWAEQHVQIGRPAAARESQQQAPAPSSKATARLEQEQAVRAFQDGTAGAGAGAEEIKERALSRQERPSRQPRP